MKLLLSKSRLIYLLAAGIIFFTTENTNGQSWPDENFCSVSASLIFNDSTCEVEGVQPFEYDNYCDNTAEDYVSWATSGGVVAVRFTPPGYPVKIVGGNIYVGDGSFPDGGNFLGTNFKVFIYDNDTSDNLPGMPLDSVTVTVNNYQWIKFGGINTVVEEGDFYLGMKQINPPQNAAPVGVDEQLPYVNRSYVKPPKESWQLSPYQDFMIRALTCYADSVTREISSETETWFQIARISGFNPNNGENPEDGTVTLLDSLQMPYYEDTLFYSLPTGYYAYALREITVGVDTTSWYYSNVVYRTPLSVNQNRCGNNEVTLYPNPVTDKLHITSKLEILSVTIFSSTGQKIFSVQPHRKELTVNTGLLRSGLYIVNISTQKGALDKKIWVRNVMNRN